MSIINETSAIMNGTSSIAKAGVGYSVLETTIFAVVAGILSLLTILGNVLVMVSFKMDKQLQTISNYFLLSLAVADFFIGLISMPLYTLYLLPTPRWPLGPLICDLWLAIDYLNSNASVLNLLVISFDRYFSVTRPLTYRVRRTTKRACLMISATWVISLLLWPPWIFAWPYIEGKRSVPEDDCYIQFLETNPYITFGTAIAAFYIPVSVMCILYWRIWRETEKRYKDLTTLFLVSAVGGRVRTAPGHHGGIAVNDDEDEEETFADRFKSFLTWPVSIFGASKKSTESTEGTEDGIDGAEEQRPKVHPGHHHGRDDPTSTTEDEDDTIHSDATCGTSSGTGKRSALASDSIYTILITLGEGPKSQTGTKSQSQLTPTTTASSAALTPVTESGYTIDGSNNCTETHTIKQFFESAISINQSPLSDEIGDNDTQPQIKSLPSPKPTSHPSVSSSIKRPSQKDSNQQSDQQKSRKVSGSAPIQRAESPGSGLRMHSGGGGQRSASNSGPSSTKAHMSSVSQPKSEKKAAKTLSAILLTFIITWTPYNVLVLIKTLSQEDSGISDNLWYFSYYLCYINSTINPLCYALCNVNFRNTYLRILKCQWTLNPTRQRVKDAQFDLPPAQSRKEKKRKNKKRNKILASRQQLQQQQSIQVPASSSTPTATLAKRNPNPTCIKSSSSGQQQQQSLLTKPTSCFIPSGQQQSFSNCEIVIAGGGEINSSNSSASNKPTGSSMIVDPKLSQGGMMKQQLLTTTSSPSGRVVTTTMTSIPRSSTLSTIQKQQQQQQKPVNRKSGTKGKK